MLKAVVVNTQIPVDCFGAKRKDTFADVRESMVWLFAHNFNI